MGSNAGRTAELWRERVLAQRASGQSVRGWCRANNCPEHGFYCWRAKLGLSPVASRKRRRTPMATSIGFARVVVEPPGPAVVGAATAAEPLRLMLLGGRVLSLPASMPVEHVARLVRAIEGKPSTIEAPDAGQDDRGAA